MKEISPYDLNFNPMEVIGGDWALLTAGNKEDGYNTMTISWAQIGSLWGLNNVDGKHWGHPVATVYVRPQRYTKEFMDRETYYTLSFFDKKHKKHLAYLGAKSGRDEDKVAKMGLEPVFFDGTTYISEADLVLVCRKLYQTPILESGFVDEAIREETYPKKDYHEMYIGQIEKVLVAEDALDKYTKL